jgi:hypothetical protein
LSGSSVDPTDTLDADFAPVPGWPGPNFLIIE